MYPIDLVFFILIVCFVVFFPLFMIMWYCVTNNQIEYNRKYRVWESFKYGLLKMCETYMVSFSNGYVVRITSLVFIPYFVFSNLFEKNTKVILINVCVAFFVISVISASKFNSFLSGDIQLFFCFVLSSLLVFSTMWFSLDTTFSIRESLLYHNLKVVLWILLFAIVLRCCIFLFRFFKNPQKILSSKKKEFIEFDLPINPVFMDFPNQFPERVKKYQRNIELFQKESVREDFLRSYHGKWIGFWEDEEKVVQIKVCENITALELQTPKSAVRTKVGFKKGKKHIVVNNITANFDNRCINQFVRN